MSARREELLAREILRLKERVDEVEEILDVLKEHIVAALRDAPPEPVHVEREGNVIEFPGGAA